ncbi:hypothetical protein TNCV_3117801 [Trichonephila clavipes]|uniref:Uncharacterized protein n=1 Tax=Trichonephila clavipes TaxID=2585209 RepID=A0A8X7BGT3_TRICX|nr:hypothetical protein TNCV_3117801 [Trichonephila clavipes]
MIAGSSGQGIVLPQGDRVPGGHETLLRGKPAVFGVQLRLIAVLVPESDETGNVISEFVNLSRQINFEMNSDDFQELLSSRNQELTIDELTEMHEQ